VSGLSHNAATTLDYSSRYYWRVTPQNICGSGPASTVFYFTTVAASMQSCSTPNMPIPDNTPAGVTDSLAVAAGGSILDLNVAISATHTWVGDLIFTLEHVDTGTSLVLIDRPGRTTAGFGCGGDNISVTLDDEATLSIETDCSDPQAYLPGGSYRPNNPLSSLDNEDINGEWLLTVSDNAGQDTGGLSRWCLQTTLPAAPSGLGIYLPVVLK
jgi:subtilisin-like proprotein convertase family protein